jgi:hypothetical protein
MYFLCQSIMLSAKTKLSYHQLTTIFYHTKSLFSCLCLVFFKPFQLSSTISYGTLQIDRTSILEIIGIHMLHTAELLLHTD